jgi:hypothetical protein
MRRLVLLLLSFQLLTHAQDSRLEAIRALLLPMRTNPVANDVRGATPVFTTVKHQLRDWIESRLVDLKWNGRAWKPATAVLQEQLNDELLQAGLFCGEVFKIACPEESSLGFLGDVILEIQGGALVVKTGVGIVCGFDESAYAYRDNENHWIRFWETEQNIYEKGKYLPQWLHQVLISERNYDRKADSQEHLILTIGSHPWCSSTWQSVYYRVWRSRSSHPAPQLLLNGSEIGQLGMNIEGSITRDDVLFQYGVGSLEGGFIRPEIHRYVLENDKLIRTDPVALSPSTFTAFWLTTRSNLSRWTAERSRAMLEKWRDDHRGPFAEISPPTLHCERQPDRWQIQTESGKEQFYFLIRWRPPYRFTMDSVSDRPFPGCTEKDPEADAPRSLFPRR